MKTKTILFAVIALFLLIGGVGCEEKLSETELMKQQLIGTWEWTVSYGGFVGKKYPIQGEKLELTFTDNYVLATYTREVTNDKSVVTDNKNILLDGSYVVSKEQDKYFITISPKEGEQDLLFLSGKNEFYIDQDTNELVFALTEGTAQFSHIYKKVK